MKRFMVASGVVLVAVGCVWFVCETVSSPAAVYDAPTPEDAARANAIQERETRGRFLGPRDYERLIERIETIKTHDVSEYAGVTFAFISFEKNGTTEYEVYDVSQNENGEWVLGLPRFVFDTGDTSRDSLQNKRLREWRHGR